MIFDIIGFALANEPLSLDIKMYINVREEAWIGILCLATNGNIQCRRHLTQAFNNTLSKIFP